MRRPCSATASWSWMTAASRMRARCGTWWPIRRCSRNSWGSAWTRINDRLLFSALRRMCRAAAKVLRRAANRLRRSGRHPPMTGSSAPLPATAPDLPRAPRDWVPLALVPALVVLAAPLFGDLSSWVTLTVAGLAMGMMVFLMASGLTLVFGLMDVINFGHGVFISLGAYATLIVLGPLAGWAQADSVLLNLGLLALCIAVAMAVTAAVGALFERIIVRPVYGSHLKQILVTVGGLIVAEQAIHAIWGASPITIPLPTTLRGAFVLGDIAVERYRVIAVVLGLVVFGAMQLVLNRTRI